MIVDTKDFSTMGKKVMKRMILDNLLYCIHTSHCFHDYWYLNHARRNNRCEKKTILSILDK